MRKYHVEPDDRTILARCMVRNHLAASFRDQGDWGAVVNDQELRTNNYPCRVVAVVGAGASAAAGFPVANKAVTLLKRHMKLTDNQEDEYQKELDRLNMVYRLEKTDFETMLLALGSTAFRAQKVRNALEHLYGNRNIPLLHYEMLAHLLKHRFLDAVVSFNFDELLDQSIKDELGEREYYNIISDGHCLLPGKLNQVLDRPVFIKPHGTVSHKSTLRFTREAYYGLPAGIHRTLEELLVPKYNAKADRPLPFFKNTRGSPQPIALMVVGFGMQSIELNRILSHAAKGSRIFYLNPKRLDELPRDIAAINFSWIPVEDPNDNHCPTLCDTLQDVSDRVSAIFKTGYKPRNYSRHKLISELFQRESRNTQILRRDSRHREFNYLHDRRIIELCLSVAKGKGLVSMSNLINDRCGAYSRKLAEVAREIGKPFVPLANLCRNLGLLEAGYGGELYRLSLPQEKPGDNGTLSPEVVIDRYKSCMARNVETQLLGDAKRRMSDRYIKSSLESTIVELARSKETEIRMESDITCGELFPNFTPIRTQTELMFETISVLANPFWKYLLIVAETGEWLLDDAIRDVIVKAKQGRGALRKMLLIVADTVMASKLEDKYRGDLQIEAREMNWWTHNRHMTLTLNANRSPLEGIYFTRRLRAERIVPTRVKNADCELLLEVFVAYSEKIEKRQWCAAKSEETVARFKDRLCDKRFWK